MLTNLHLHQGRHPWLSHLNQFQPRWDKAGHPFCFMLHKWNLYLSLSIYLSIYIYIYLYTLTYIIAYSVYNCKNKCVCVYIYIYYIVIYLYHIYICIYYIVIYLYYVCIYILHTHIDQNTDVSNLTSRCSYNILCIYINIC